MNKYCPSCIHDNDIGFCDKCFYNHILEEKGIPPTEYEERKAMTNYDRIQAMNYEELAKQIAGEQVNGVRVFLHGLDYELEKEFMDEVKKTWPELVQEKLDWLKQEAET